MPRLNTGSVDLSEDEIDWLKVICNLSGTSLRAQFSQIISGHIVRFKPHYSRKVAYVARKYGLTWEEAFQQLTQGQPPFGEVVQEAPAIEEEEKSHFGCEVRQPKQDEEKET